MKNNVEYLLNISFANDLKDKLTKIVHENKVDSDWAISGHVEVVNQTYETFVSPLGTGSVRALTADLSETMKVKVKYDSFYHQVTCVKYDSAGRMDDELNFSAYLSRCKTDEDIEKFLKGLAIMIEYNFI